MSVDGPSFLGVEWAHMPHAKVIVNPAAGAGRTGRDLPRILAYLRDTGPDFEHELTTARGQATDLAKSAARAGCSLIVSVGGDGTVNEIANGLLEAGYLDKVAVGIVCTGTGADYIRTLGLPRDVREACKRLRRPARRDVDLGIVEYSNGGNIRRRAFINSAGVGLDAEMARANTGTLKGLGSRLSFFAGYLKTLMSHRNFEVCVKVDQDEQRLKASIVLVGNGRFGGGGMRPTPDADPGDGLFDIMIVGDMSRFDLLRLVPHVYRGTHVKLPLVTMKRGSRVEIASEQPIPLQADGELLGEAPARFTATPGALRIVV